MRRHSTTHLVDPAPRMRVLDVGYVYVRRQDPRAIGVGPATSRQALWYAFGLAIPAAMLALRMGANELSVVPVLLTAIALASRRGRGGGVLRITCAAVYAGLIVIGSLSVGALFVPSFVALVVAIVMDAWSAQPRPLEE